MRYVRRPVALCAICSLLLPVAAQGQAGVQLDPNSPAGVEYQLPLEQARKNANGEGGGGERPGSGEDRAGGGGVASLFGAGIVPASARDGAADGEVGGAGVNGRASGGGAGGAEADVRGAGERSTPGSSAIRPAALDGVDEGGGSAGLRIAGIALAVLAAGALLGLALRRGLRQSGE